MIKAIVLRGDFTAGELARLVSLIREFDDARPDAVIEVTAVDPEAASIEVADQIMREVLPAMQHRLTEIKQLPLGWPAYLRQKSKRGMA